jgi:hypothetical protein
MPSDADASSILEGQNLNGVHAVENGERDRPGRIQSASRRLALDEKRFGHLVSHLT